MFLFYYILLSLFDNRHIYIVVDKWERDCETMNSKKIKPWFFVIIAISLLLICAGCTEQTPDDTQAEDEPNGNTTVTVAALVNGEEILMEDVTSMQQSSAQQGQQLSEQQALEQLIDQEVLTQHALQDEFLPTDEEVEDQIDVTLQQYNMTQEELEQQLQQSGMTYEEYTQSVEESLATQNSLSEAVEDYDVSDEEAEQQIDMMLQQYNMTKEEFTQQLQQSGMTYDGYIDQMKQQIVQNQLIEDLKEEAEIEYKI